MVLTLRPKKKKKAEQFFEPAGAAAQQTWLSYSLTEQHLKNNKSNSPRFTDSNNN